MGRGSLQTPHAMGTTTILYLQWLISICIVYSRSQHENRLSLNMTSLLPVFAMSVNVTVYMYRRRRALESIE